MNWLILSADGTRYGTQREALRATRAANEFEDACDWVDAHRMAHGFYGGRPEAVLDPALVQIVAKVLKGRDLADLGVRGVFALLRDAHYKLTPMRSRELHRYVEAARNRNSGQ